MNGHGGSARSHNAFVLVSGVTLKRSWQQWPTSRLQKQTSLKSDENEEWNRVLTDTLDEALDSK